MSLVALDLFDDESGLLEAFSKQSLAGFVEVGDLGAENNVISHVARRGWDMSDLAPELSALPVAATLDGELVAFGPDGSPNFPLLCERMLMRHPGIAVTYMVFDLLSYDGEDLTRAPYSERRAQLEALDLNGVHWQTPEAFDDGEALFEAVCAHELERVVAKRRGGRYVPGERGWVKTKNREYWRYEMERESALNRPRVKQFV